jgi:hypothetical protein
MQTTAQTSPRKGGNPAWIKGVSGNPRGSETAAQRRARVAAKVDAWAAELGGKIGAVERTLLQRAAELSLLRPRRVEDMTRVTNTISKLLAQAGFHRYRKREQPSELAGLLDDRHG